MSYKRIGNYIRPVSNRNKDLTVTNLLGVNISKNFMPSVANTSWVDLSKYKIIRKGQFATNIMHVDRDEVLPISLYQKEQPAIVSPAYMTFEIVDENVLLPEFLMMEFQRPEFDRQAWTYCDSSVRGGLEWERFCEIEIPIPDIDEQRKFVALYNGLLTNQKTYDNSLADLQLVCNYSMENLKKIEPLKLLSSFIRLVDNRNKDLSVKKVCWVSMKKYFIPSIANTNTVDLSNYKIVKKGQFGLILMKVGRDNQVSVGYLQDDDAVIISPAYHVFEIIDENILLPEFLMMWLSRPENDRWLGYISASSVRGSITFDEFCTIKLPIPDIKVQEAIVTIYHTLDTRKRINEQLKNTIKPLCPVLMKGVIELLTQ